MKAESLTIEIAGETVLLRAKEGRLPDLVRDLPDEFKKKPLAGVPGGSARYSVLFSRRKLPRIELPKNGGMNSAIEIKARNGVFEVGLKSKPMISLGVIYADKGKADFFLYDRTLNHNYFIPFLRSAFQFFIMPKGEFMLHASAVNLDGAGLVFTGPSGAGKTTISDFYPKKSVLSDEYVYLRKTGDDYFISATPWRSRNPGTCKLTRIVFPEKSRKLEIIEEKPGAAAYKIMANITYMPENFRISENILSFLAELTKKTPCCTMRFPKNDKFKKVV